ncbi:glycosyltransferase [Oenococcus oeni]|uniref:glycosyltransferase n=1 Tax=Oenococcus oeni TaxID=1247 RepID=UPI000510128A|nr:glycosyltransferase [Oenococcus oeni]KGH58624.1 hypothetical protein X288_06855 [Oenococcus oeni IOEB_9805]
MNDKIKISIIAPNLSGRGGTENVLNYVVNSKLIRSKFDFELFLSDGTVYTKWLSRLTIDNDKIILNSRNKFIKVINKFIFFVKTNSQIVIVLGSKTAFIANIVRKIFNKKYKIVSWIHFSIFNVSTMNPKYLKYADYHLAISSQMIPQFNKIGIDASKIYVIYNPCSRKKKIIPSSSDGKFRIIFVGRIQLIGQKNIKEMIDAISCSKPLRKTIFDLYGDGEDLPLVKEYARKKMPSNVETNFHGWMDNPWKNIKMADALLMSSKFEGFGLAPAEAISYGIPVISADYPVGARDLIKKGINGFLYKPNNPREMAEYIKKVENGFFRLEERSKILLVSYMGTNMTKGLLKVFWKY